MNTDKIRIRLKGEGVDEAGALTDAYTRAVEMYPHQTEWEFLFWEPYESTTDDNM